MGGSALAAGLEGVSMTKIAISGFHKCRYAEPGIAAQLPPGK